MKEGTKVNVHFTSSSSLFNVEILYIPCATGDSWRLKDADGKEHYVQMFERIEEIKSDNTSHNKGIMQAEDGQHNT